MKLLLVLSGICVALLSMGARAEAQNYPWCAIYGGFTTAGQIAVSRPLSSAWPPREGSAVIVSRIRNTSRHQDRIRQSGFKGAIHIKPHLSN